MGGVGDLGLNTFPDWLSNWQTTVNPGSDGCYYSFDIFTDNVD